MKNLSKVKIIKLAVVIILVSVGLLILVPYSRLNNKVAQADILMMGEAKVLAFREYQKALVEWPILKLNLDYQKKSSNAERIVIEYKKTHAAVIIFLKENVTHEQTQNLIKELKGMDGVVGVKYVSKEGALKVYKDNNKSDPELIKLVTADILPDSIEIYLLDWDKVDQFYNLYDVTDRPYIQDVTFPSDIWKKLN